jgi:hypothetical protein
MVTSFSSQLLVTDDTGVEQVWLVLIENLILSPSYVGIEFFQGVAFWQWIFSEVDCILSQKGGGSVGHVSFSDSAPGFNFKPRPAL